jgi:hypothetical protein
MKAFPGNRFEGMELRDYFAAKSLPLAMKWVKHNYDVSLKAENWMWNEEEYETDGLEIAICAYHIADAMMQAREVKHD